MFLFLTLLFACQQDVLEAKQRSDKAPTLSKPFSLCSKYTEKKIFEYCIYQKASHLFSVQDVHYYCPMSGEWEESCRHTWGMKRLRMMHENKLSLEALLDGCGGFSDCSFEVIDARPSKDILLQLERCSVYVVADFKDCVLHALQRWYSQSPSAEEVSLLLKGFPQLSDQASEYVANIVYCRGIGTCEGDNPSHRNCRRQIKRLRKKPSLCNRMTGSHFPKETPLKPNPKKRFKR